MSHVSVRKLFTSYLSRSGISGRMQMRGVWDVVAFRAPLFDPLLPKTSRRTEPAASGLVGAPMNTSTSWHSSATNCQAPLPGRPSRCGSQAAPSASQSGSPMKPERALLGFGSVSDLSTACTFKNQPPLGSQSTQSSASAPLPTPIHNNSSNFCSSPASQMPYGQTESPESRPSQSDGRSVATKPSVRRECSTGAEASSRSARVLTSRSLRASGPDSSPRSDRARSPGSRSIHELESRFQRSQRVVAAINDTYLNALRCQLVAPLTVLSNHRVKLNTRRRLLTLVNHLFICSSQGQLPAKFDDRVLRMKNAKKLMHTSLVPNENHVVMGRVSQKVFADPDIIYIEQKLAAEVGEERGFFDFRDRRELQTTLMACLSESRKKTGTFGPLRMRNSAQIYRSQDGSIGAKERITLKFATESTDEHDRRVLEPYIQALCTPDDHPSPFFYDERVSVGGGQVEISRFTRLNRRPASLEERDAAPSYNLMEERIYSQSSHDPKVHQLASCSMKRRSVRKRQNPPKSQTTLSSAQPNSKTATPSKSLQKPKESTKLGGFPIADILKNMDKDETTTEPVAKPEPSPVQKPPKRIRPSSGPRTPKARPKKSANQREKGLVPVMPCSGICQKKYNTAPGLCVSVREMAVRESGKNRKHSSEDDDTMDGVLSLREQLKRRMKDGVTLQPFTNSTTMMENGGVPPDQQAYFNGLAKAVSSADVAPSPRVPNNVPVMLHEMPPSSGRSDRRRARKKKHRKRKNKSASSTKSSGLDTPSISTNCEPTYEVSQPLSSDRSVSTSASTKSSKKSKKSSEPKPESKPDKAGEPRDMRLRTNVAGVPVELCVSMSASRRGVPVDVRGVELWLGEKRLFEAPRRKS